MLNIYKALSSSTGLTFNAKKTVLVKMNSEYVENAESEKLLSTFVNHNQWSNINRKLAHLRRVKNSCSILYYN